MNTEEVYERLNKVHRECLRQLGAGGGWLLDPSEVVIQNEKDPDEVGKWHALHEIVCKLEDVCSQLNYLETPVSVEGVLQIKPNGRYCIGNYEITSGDVIEILVEDEDRPYWLRTGIEHNGTDYYAVNDSGVLKERRARIRFKPL